MTQLKEHKDPNFDRAVNERVLEYIPHLKQPVKVSPVADQKIRARLKVR